MRFLEVVVVLGLTPLELMHFLRPLLGSGVGCGATTVDCGINYDGNVGRV